MSLRATARVTETSKTTVMKLLVEIGAATTASQDAALRNLNIDRIEADEIWSFCYSKQKNIPEEYRGTFGYGDVWTWVAIDADTKLVPSWLVGERTLEDCYTFLRDLRGRIKIGNRIQLSTDGLGVYQPVVHALWGNKIDYAIIVKDYASPPAEEARRYSPATCTSIQKHKISGEPDEDLVSTSYVERQNLTMRMG